ncbi:MAG: hypothetical protein IK092_07025 [Muribaculaceae bacterium]|nr:hypothetical protein [Muribaculaceae bacterium]
MPTSNPQSYKKFLITIVIEEKMAQQVFGELVVLDAIGLYVTDETNDSNATDGINGTDAISVAIGKI